MPEKHATKYIAEGGATHTRDSAQLLLVLTDGSPSDQNQAEVEAKAAIGEGVVIVGVGVNVGSYGVPPNV